MAIALTLSQIVELSGGDARRMKQLANDGVFLPIEEDRPSRSARRYSVSEAAIACIIAKLDAFRIAPSTLAALAENLRSIYEVPIRHGFKNRDEGKRLWAREILLGFDKGDHKIKDVQDRKELALKMGLDEYPTGKMLGLDSDEMHRINDWTNLEGAREGERLQMFLNVGNDGSWHYWLSQPIKDQEQEVYIVLNLHRILNVLR